MDDSAYPLSAGQQPVVDAVLIYTGGDTPHTWTPGDVAAQRARYRFPIYVRSNPGQASFVQDANEQVRWLKANGVPKGAATGLDLESAVSPGYVSAFGHILNLEGYLVYPYGGLLMVWQNPHLDGLYVAHWTDVPHLCTPARCGGGLNANAVMTQWANDVMLGKPYDLSLISSGVPLWDSRPPPAPPPLPPPSPQRSTPIPGEKMRILSKNIPTGPDGNAWIDFALGGSVVCGAPWVVCAAPGEADVPVRQWPASASKDTYDHAHAEVTVGAAPGSQRVSVVDAVPNHPVYTVCLPVTP